MGLYNEVFGIPDNDRVSINSKKKGDRNENCAAKFLTSWVGSVFKRVPRSGGLGGSIPNLSGDVLDLSGKFIFCVETKHYKHIPHIGKLRSSSKLITFWNQCVRDADRISKKPLLLFRENNMKSGKYIMFFDCFVSNIIKEKFLVTPIAYFEIDGLFFGFESDTILEKVKYIDLCNLIS